MKMKLFLEVGLWNDYIRNLVGRDATTMFQRLNALNAFLEAVGSDPPYQLRQLAKEARLGFSNSAPSLVWPDVSTNYVMDIWHCVCSVQQDSFWGQPREGAVLHSSHALPGRDGVQQV